MAETRYVAFFRGINVGRAKRIAMADLRNLVSDLGYSDPKTLLNSGNLIFTAPAMPSAELASIIETEVESRLGVFSKVTVLKKADLTKIIKENPLLSLATDHSRFLVGMFGDNKCAKDIAKLIGQDWTPDSLAVGKHAAYLWCSTGILQSKLLLAV